MELVDPTPPEDGRGVDARQAAAESSLEELTPASPSPATPAEGADGSPEALAEEPPRREPKPRTPRETRLPPSRPSAAGATRAPFEPEQPEPEPEPTAVTSEPASEPKLGHPVLPAAEPTVTRPPASAERSVGRAEPKIVIGRVDVVVAAPEAGRARPEPPPRRSGASRLYLRRL